MIFEVDIRDVDIMHFENPEVDPCILFPGDPRARMHLIY